MAQERAAWEAQQREADFKEAVADYLKGDKHRAYWKVQQWGVCRVVWDAWMADPESAPKNPSRYTRMTGLLLIGSDDAISDPDQLGPEG